MILDHTSTKGESVTFNTSVIANPYDGITTDENKMHLKRDSRHAVADEEPITDWIPEIPFWNVILTKFTILSLKCKREYAIFKMTGYIVIHFYKCFNDEI